MHAFVLYGEYLQDLEEKNGRMSTTHYFTYSYYTAYLKVVCTVLMLMTCCCWSQCEIAISICENIFTVFIAKVWYENLVVWALQFWKYDFGVVVQFFQGLCFQKMLFYVHSF